MEIRSATLAIAELAQMASDNMVDHFWADSQQPGQSLEAVGAGAAKSESANFILSQYTHHLRYMAKSPACYSHIACPPQKITTTILWNPLNSCVL